MRVGSILPALCPCVGADDCSGGVPKEKAAVGQNRTETDSFQVIWKAMNREREEEA